MVQETNRDVETAEGGVARRAHNSANGGLYVQSRPSRDCSFYKKIPHISEGFLLMVKILHFNSLTFFRI